MSISGKNHYNWKGGFYINHSGYKLILMPEHHRADCKGYVYEHFVVMEKKIGRLLIAGENVHHINKNKSDNRQENLQLFSSLTDHLKHEANERRKKWETNGKLCARCEKVKPLTEFIKNLTCCKSCENIRHKKWRDKNATKLREYWSLYRAAHRG